MAVNLKLMGTRYLKNGERPEAPLAIWLEDDGRLRIIQLWGKGADVVIGKDAVYKLVRFLLTNVV